MVQAFREQLDRVSHFGKLAQAWNSFV